MPQDTGSNPLENSDHRAFLMEDARRQIDFFQASLRPDHGFYILNHNGSPIDTDVQELHTTTRLVHSYVLGKLAGVAGCDAIIDQGIRYLNSHHKDQDHGGYVWAMDGQAVHDQRKLAYGPVVGLLAASSAKMVDHPDADALMDDVVKVLNEKYWEEDHGLFADEFNQDWTPFSKYRGMNANMHGVEALVTAFEATGREEFLNKAGRILDFFLGQMAPAYSWRLPEHYRDDWTVDPGYSENPMFRPAGTTPGHSFELARLLLQHWDLSGRADENAPEIARQVAYTALNGAWDPERGGFFYTLDFDGTPAIRDRYWWPVTEAIGVVAAFLKSDPRTEDAEWYDRLWGFAKSHFIDAERGGWFPEIDDENQPCAVQFNGKPDIYHSLQAALFPLAPGVSCMATNLPNISKTAA